MIKTLFFFIKNQIKDNNNKDINKILTTTIK
jgi:hypothetical protein